MTGIEQKKRGELLINGKRHYARIFQVKGESVELYKIGALASAMDRSVQTIKIWEIEGWLPKPMFRINGHGLGHCHRWYSKEQIINLRHVSKLYPYSQGRPGLRKSFFEAARKVFYQTSVVTLKPKEPTHGKSERPEQRPAHSLTRLRAADGLRGLESPVAPADDDPDRPTGPARPEGAGGRENDGSPEQGHRRAIRQGTPQRAGGDPGVDRPGSRDARAV